MRIMIKKLQLLLPVMALLLAFPACTADFEDINTNPNQVTKSDMNAQNYNVGAKIRTLAGLVIPITEHMYQFNESLTGGPLAGYIGATVDTWETKFETFNPSADWRKWPFANVITETYAPYKGVINETDDEVAIALAKLFRVAVMHRVTDSYGPIPYSQLENNEEVYVGYDSQEEVYNRMFEELDEVIGLLKGNITLSDEAWVRYDDVYFGNIAKWVRYACSLKLRMAMRLTEVKPDVAKAKAGEAIAEGVITDNDGNAAMHTMNNRLTLIYNDWSDHRVGGDIIAYMNGYKDPRLDKMFTKNKAGKFAGIRIGAPVGSKQAAIDGCSNMIVTSGTPYLWFNAAEAAFLRAEYELRWGDAAEAGALYEEGIRLSFEEKGLTAVQAAAYAENTALKPARYEDPTGGTFSMPAPQSDITIAWVDGEDDATKEKNLERIITQKWIALFPLGVEAWSEYRRTGYPKLMPVPAEGDFSHGDVDLAHGARRLQYPVEEYDRNGSNLQQAVSMLDAGQQNGNRTGDKMGTRVWWDCKPY